MTAELESPANSFLVVTGTQVTMLPGVVPCRGSASGDRCDVSLQASLNNKCFIPGIAEPIDLTGKTLFQVVHRTIETPDSFNRDTLVTLLDQAIHAIGDLFYWGKVVDKAKKMSPYVRRIGLLDIALMIVPHKEEGAVHVHEHPIANLSPAMNAVISSTFRGVEVRPNPLVQRLPRSIDRAMGVLDLINMGFYFEAFVSAFAMLDDLTQRVVIAGLDKKGVENSKELLRAIKERRLEYYLTVLLELTGWTSLKTTDEKLFKELLRVNSRRNKAMHNDREVPREECIDSVHTIFRAIHFLASNPFDIQYEWLDTHWLVAPTFKQYKWAAPSADESEIENANDPGPFHVSKLLEKAKKQQKPTKLDESDTDDKKRDSGDS